MDTDYAQSLFEAIADSAVLLDKTGRIVDWNQGATALFGYHKKEVVGRSINLIYQQNQPFLKIIQEMMSPQKKWVNELPYIRKNGVKGFCKTTVGLVDSQGMHNKVVALMTHQNISSYKTLESESHNKLTMLSRLRQEDTELSYFMATQLIKNSLLTEQMETRLRESELRFHLLAENATDIISRHAADGTYLYISPSCKTLLGYSPEELLNYNSSKFVHYDDISKLKKAFKKRRKNLPHQTLTYRIRRKEGDYRWFESNIRHIYDEKTRTVREIQSASRDITNHILDKKARLRGQQIAHISRLSSMEEMASGMAHEISQPLAAIVNYTQGCVRYLQNDKLEANQLIEIMKKAVIQAERAGEVIHRLKNFFCKGQLFKTPCKMNSLIRETVSLIRHDLNTSKTKIDFNLAKNVQLISADKIQLQQVLLNLIQNSIDAMQSNELSKRRIQIQSKAHDTNTITIIVRDTGPGFPKDATHKIFEPFFTTKAHGRGMGLAICRSIIEAHGGRFFINSNNNMNHNSWIGFNLPIN